MSEHIKITVDNDRIYQVAALISHMLTTFGETCSVEIVNDYDKQNITTNIGNITVDSDYTDSGTLVSTLERIRERFGLGHVHGEPIEHQAMRVEDTEKPRFVESGPIEMRPTPHLKSLFETKD